MQAGGCQCDTAEYSRAEQLSWLDVTSLTSVLSLNLPPPPLYTQQNKNLTLYIAGSAKALVLHRSVFIPPGVLSVSGSPGRPASSTAAIRPRLHLSVQVLRLRSAEDGGHHRQQTGK